MNIVVNNIKNTVEANSKKMQKYSLRIQELKDELDSIDSQMKWAPHAALDDKMEKDVYYMRQSYDVVDLLADLISGKRPMEDHDSIAKQRRVEELRIKRIPIQEELDKLVFEKEKLRKENIELRLQLQNIKEME